MGTVKLAGAFVFACLIIGTASAKTTAVVTRTSVPCTIPNSNGTGAQTKTCVSATECTVGPCVLVSCNTGYLLQSGACIKQVCMPGTAKPGASSTPCSVFNGSGTQTPVCNSSGSGYYNGVCVATSCNSGYVLQSGNCLKQVCNAGGSYVTTSPATNGITTAAIGTITETQTCNSYGTGPTTAPPTYSTACNTGYTLNPNPEFRTSPTQACLSTQPNQLTMGGSSGVPGQCVLYVVYATNSSGAIAITNSAIPVTFAPLPPNNYLYSDSTCTTQTGSVTIGAGTSQGTKFYFRSSNTGTVTVQASAPGLAGGTYPAVTVAPPSSRGR